MIIRRHDDGLSLNARAEHELRQSSDYFFHSIPIWALWPKKKKINLKKKIFCVFVEFQLIYTEPSSSIYSIFTAKNHRNLSATNRRSRKRFDLVVIISN